MGKSDIWRFRNSPKNEHFGNFCTVYLVDIIFWKVIFVLYIIFRLFAKFLKEKLLYNFFSNYFFVLVILWHVILILGEENK